MDALIHNSDLLAAVVTIISAVGAGFWGIVKWVISRFEHHDERITTLERTSVDQKQFDEVVAGVYRKVDDGFRHLNERLDQLYQLLIQQARKP